jgi:hypothetical protein
MKTINFAVYCYNVIVNRRLTLCNGSASPYIDLIDLGELQFSNAFWVGNTAIKNIIIIEKIRAILHPLAGFAD